MSAALSWLNDLIQWLGRWIPRLVLIYPTHRGVRFGPRGGAIAVGPGLVCYWPITHDLVQVAVTTQSIQLCGQILPLKEDGGLFPRVAVFTLSLQFTITDPVLAATQVLNFHALIANRAQALATIHWPFRLTESRDWIARVEQELRGEMDEYGIQLKSLAAAGLGTGVVLKNVSDWQYSDNIEGKRLT